MTVAQAATNIRSKTGVVNGINPEFHAQQIEQVGESIDNLKTSVIQAKYTGNTLSGFANGEFQRVDLSLGATLNGDVATFTADMPNRDINDLFDSTNNLIKYNPVAGVPLNIRIIFSFASKEVNKDYVAVWKIKFPDTAPISFEENITVQMKKKDAAELNIPLNIVTVSTVNNISSGLELYVAIQKKDETDVGDTTTTVISPVSITTFHSAAAV